MEKSEKGLIKRLDEVVVNRIAAGEVIQRPSNAIKEMLENSLDAGSTSINIMIKSGGLKMLRISDNGHGINQNDLSIVCERFTTSKLREFDDLKSINTFGFRGEALASISHVGHLSITSRTKDSKCAYKASYVDGKLLSAPQPCAGNIGTQIVVEDLFYNVVTRKKAFSSDLEEQQKIANIVLKYSIHNSGIAFSLCKTDSGVGNVIVKTQNEATVQENISLLYGSNIGKELLMISEKNASYKLKIDGYISNANCSLKKLNFILFINNRLVDCPPLKHCLETIYQNYLPKGSHPFMYISLQIAPNNLDVNVHPTKHKVQFLNEEEIVECVSKCVESRLLECDTSRTFYTQKLFSVSKSNKLQDNNSSNSSSSSNNLKKKIEDYHLVRSDSKLQKLDAFLPKISLVKSDIKTQTLSLQSVPVTTAKFKKKRQICLTSVLQLQNDIKKSTDHELTELMHEHTFVGIVDAEFALLQHTTKLYLLNTTKLSQELFYQILIKDFGNFPMVCLSEPAPIYDLAILGLNLEQSGWTAADGNKNDLAVFLVKFYNEKSEMLKDYFSLEIKDGNLLSIPLLLDKYIPPLEGLAMLVLRLATEVNWEEEKECFLTLCRELAIFFSVRKGFVDFDEKFEANNNKGHIVKNNSNENNSKKWEWTVEHIIYRAMKEHLCVPTNMSSNGCILQLANLLDLYKVFERC